MSITSFYRLHPARTFLLSHLENNCLNKRPILAAIAMPSITHNPLPAQYWHILMMKLCHPPHEEDTQHKKDKGQVGLVVVLFFVQFRDQV